MRIGSLFSGMGGLDLAAEHIFGAEVAWHAENDKHASKVLAARWPGVPNLGDVTTIDWSQAPPVDIITAGYPCQPFSVAGTRKGTDDARHLWPHAAAAVRALRPRWVLLENVAGHLRLGFHTVLADLAQMGLDAEWGTVRASETGAPHLRDRLFILAHPAIQRGDGQAIRHDGPASHRQTGKGIQQPGGIHRTPANPDGRQQQGAAPGRGLPIPAQHPDPRGQEAHQENGDGRGAGPHPPLTPLLPTPDDATHGRKQTRTSTLLPGVVEKLLPTPCVNDMGANKEIEWWDEWAPRQKAGDGRTAPHGKSLSIEVRRSRLLPTPRAQNGEDRNNLIWERPLDQPQNLENALARDFGPYTPAIRRWENTLGRQAPPPTENGKDGRPRLSPPFVEWMMGLPEGWVTDPRLGIPRTQQLKLLGNGVVPHQAALALQHLLAQTSAHI